MSKKINPNKALFLVVIGIALVVGGWVMMAQNKRAVPDGSGNVRVTGAQTSGLATPPATPGEEKLMAASSTPQPAAAATSQPGTEPWAPVAPVKPTPVMEPTGRFLGKKDAPIQIIEFASLTCSHCAHFHNTILDDFRVKFVDTGLVRLEFRAFPLNKPALDATLVLHCLPEKQYFPFMAMLYQTQDHWAFANDYRTSLKQSAKLAGLSDAAVDACLNDKAAMQKLAERVKADVEKYKLESTPTFIINDGAARVVGAYPVDEFAKQIAPFLPTEKEK